MCFTNWKRSSKGIFGLSGVLGVKSSLEVILTVGDLRTCNNTCCMGKTIENWSLNCQQASMPMSFSRVESQLASHVVIVMDRYSASAEDLSTINSFFYFLGYRWLSQKDALTWRLVIGKPAQRCHNRQWAVLQMLMLVRCLKRLCQDISTKSRLTCNMEYLLRVTELSGGFSGWSDCVVFVTLWSSEWWEWLVEEVVSSGGYELVGYHQ